MSVRLTILGSGSGGNCAYLESDETRLLVDAGFSARQIRQRLATIQRTPETLHGILITHEHSDHVQGLAVLCARLDLPIYCNRLTRDALARQMPGPRPWRTFETGAAFEVGDFAIETFSVPHDAQDPVGFLVQHDAGSVGFLTDLGHATRLVIERVRRARVLLLEANHDLKLLQADTRRPWSVKQRILGRHGHLSNDAAGAVAQEVLGAELRHLYLGHLSRDCNRPDLAQQVVSQRLREAGAAHVQIELTSQEAVSPTLSLDAYAPPAPCACGA